MDISYACNDAYINQTVVSMTSLFENNREVDFIKIWFIDMGLSINSKELLKAVCCDYNRQIEFIKFHDIASDLSLGGTGRHIASVYAKIFFTRLPDSLNKILYLDSDTVVVNRLSDLWNLDLSGYSLAAVETLHTIEQNTVIDYGINDRAINDGVTLINVKYWRENRLTDKCLAYINKWHGCPPVLSEGTINYVCKNSMLIVSPKYNLMSGIVGQSCNKLEVLTGRRYYDSSILNDANNNPVIIHYLSGFYNRPWFSDCTHPLKKYYLHYKSISRVSDVPIERKPLPIRIKLIGVLYKVLPINAFVSLRKFMGKGGA